MPGAPVEPGKALNDSGGPYGLPGAMNSSSQFLSLGRGCFEDCGMDALTSVWIVSHGRSSCLAVASSVQLLRHSNDF